ncbi:hypothetical protein EV190_101893 [Actinorugispora endophytica]|uniref:Uncharacterized protein n=2 Tax=Actinorugispora endophytica TaxID=1605990 RepID=A0A4R6V5D3_9ACTN|nr:hypothetical protein EV190_101893 [Actinorugispora endophytica]
MDSSTFSMPEGAAPYRVAADYEVRIPNSGEHAHTSSNPLLGQADTSRGRVNMNHADSRWFYGNTLVGDPFIVTGSPRAGGRQRPGLLAALPGRMGGPERSRRAGRDRRRHRPGSAYSGS